MYRGKSSLLSLFGSDEHLSELARIIKSLPVEDHPLCKIKPKFDELIARVKGKLAGYYSIGKVRLVYSVKSFLVAFDTKNV